MDNITNSKQTQFLGKYQGEVVNNGFELIDENEPPKDPENRNRVQVRVFGLHGEKTQGADVAGEDFVLNKINMLSFPWAEIETPILLGGNIEDDGISNVPRVGSIVYVQFIAGEFMKPVITGFVKNSSNYHSEFNGDITVLKSKSGHEIVINDTEGQSSVEIRHKSGMVLKMNENEDENNLLISAGENGNVQIEGKSVQFFSTESGGTTPKYPILSPSNEPGENITIGTNSFETGNIGFN